MIPSSGPLRASTSRTTASSRRSSRSSRAASASRLRSSRRRRCRPPPSSSLVSASSAARSAPSRSASSIRPRWVWASCTRPATASLDVRSASGTTSGSWVLPGPVVGGMGISSVRPVVDRSQAPLSIRPGRFPAGHPGRCGPSRPATPPVGHHLRADRAARGPRARCSPHGTAACTRTQRPVLLPGLYDGCCAAHGQGARLMDRGQGFFRAPAKSWRRSSSEGIASGLAPLEVLWHSLRREASEPERRTAASCLPG